MKKYFNQFKPFLFFLGKFLFTYFILTLAYQSYLNQFDVSKFQVDGFTVLVTKQTVNVLEFFNYNSHETKNLLEPCMNLYFQGKFVSRIIEGCNGLSVIILFASFVVAFTGKWQQTVLYIIAGSLLIHVLNVVRIALLSICMFYFPEYQDLLHSVVFPLFIYGVVFVLWVIWVNKFSVYAKNSSK